VRLSPKFYFHSAAFAKHIPFDHDDGSYMDLSVVALASMEHYQASGLEVDGSLVMVLG